MGSDLISRSVTGILFLLVMIGGILYSETSLLLLFGLIVLLGTQEFCQLVNLKATWLYAIVNLSAFVGFHFFPAYSVPIIGLVLLTFVLMAWTHEEKLNAFAMYGLGFLLVTMAFTTLKSPLIAMDARRGILFFFILLWTNDTMAYVSGKTLGRHKLWERISPKKTWEGFIGGVLFAMLVAYFFGIQFGHGTYSAIGMALLIGVFGTLGDLLESSIKRRFRVKDSGSLLPGHGGILDRFDGVMLAAPMVYFYLSITAV